MKRLYLKLLLIGLFGIAMAALEAIVVVYLRHMYYPHGFGFPLSQASRLVLSEELVREAATLVMLVSVGFLAGKGFVRGVSWFLMTFGIWDSFYYVWLKIFLDWPSSLLTWDLLFLIPVPWVGPVLAPVICSLTMIVLSFWMIYLTEKDYVVKIKAFEWVLGLFGAAVILFTFIKDYSALLIKQGVYAGLNPLTDRVPIREVMAQFSPQQYNWLIFTLGEVLIIGAFLSVVCRARRLKV
ncbi:MAG: hypothetical protein Q8914_09740 [Bacteroidota bacterium]|nr:hypothetical protein [Bacteroidota bacterium]